MLSLLYLLVAPLTAQPHHDWAILVGSCFATFVLADTTITNARGSDAHRVHPAPAHQGVAGTDPDHQEPGAPGGVGTPILIATAVITLAGETPARLLITLPAVLAPVLVWLGSATWCRCCCRSPGPLIERWGRRDHRAIARWFSPWPCRTPCAGGWTR